MMNQAMALYGYKRSQAIIPPKFILQGYTYVQIKINIQIYVHILDPSSRDKQFVGGTLSGNLSSFHRGCHIVISKNNCLKQFDHGGLHINEIVRVTVSKQQTTNTHTHISRLVASCVFGQSNIASSISNARCHC